MPSGLCRMDLHRDPPRLLLAVEAREEEHRLPSRVGQPVAADLRRELGREAPRGVAFREMAREGRDPAPADDVTGRKLFARDGCTVARGVIHQIVTASPLGIPLVRNDIEMPLSVRTSDACTVAVVGPAPSTQPVTSAPCRVEGSACAAIGNTSAASKAMVPSATFISVPPSVVSLDADVRSRPIRVRGRSRRRGSGPWPEPRRATTRPVARASRSPCSKWMPP